MAEWINRTPAILPKPASIGAGLLVWTVLAHASTAQFTGTLLRGITYYLDKHAWVGFVTGFGFLVFAIFWPDIRPHVRGIIKWIAERTPEQRLNVVENQIRHHVGKHLDTEVTFEKLYVEAGHSVVPKLSERAERTEQRLSVLEDLKIDQQIKGLKQTWSDFVTEAKRLEQLTNARLAVLENASKAFESWLGPDPPLTFPQFTGMVDRNIEKSENLNERITASEAMVQAHRHSIGCLSSDITQLRHDIGINLNTMRKAQKDLRLEAYRSAKHLGDSIVPMEDITLLASECWWSIDRLRHIRNLLKNPA